MVFNKTQRDFQPRWRHRKILFASLHNQKKDNRKFKNKKITRTARKLTVWKSNYQGVKKETFIQNNKRSGDEHQGWRGQSARWQLEDQVSKVAAGELRWARQPHICMWINREEQTIQPRVLVWGKKA